jgi:hypothetical protein
MPVIRGQPTASILPPERRRALLQQLVNELVDRPEPNGPVVFEIPLEQTDKMDVLVVWQAFEGLRSEDRTGLILDAYEDKKDRVSQALGVTYQEAMDQQLLPYAVIPMTRPGEIDDAELRKAMLAEGGLLLSDRKVDLLFPVMAMAEAAHKRLCDRLPRGYWSIAQTVGQIP